MEFAAFVGWDWADNEHQLSVRTAGQSQIVKTIVAGGANAIHEWAAAQLKAYEGARIAVCIEGSRGAAIHALMCYPNIVLFPVNPKSASSLRDALFPSGKKDDPVDSDVLRLLVDKHREHLRAFEPDDVMTRKLAILSEQRKKVSNDITRTTNRLLANLKGYYPQAADLVGDLDSTLACEFLDKWPTLQSLKRSRAATIAAFYRQHHCRSAERIQERLELIRTAMALTDDEALVDGGAIRTLSSVMALRGLLGARKLLDDEIAKTYKSHPEHDLIDSFPGAGPIMGARLVALLGSNRERFTSAEELQLLTGVAPVTRQSGGRKNGTQSVHRRLQRSKFLHQTIVEWASYTIAHSEWARACYDRLRARGASRFSALRVLGYKWLRILFRCWSPSRLYSEQHHIAELRRRGSSLAAALQ
ncbi:MAG: IS110 family transposase, partial [Actinobacteria bacterium]|nr:IS110 family transposase [Actinomycetota bacterium]